MKFRVDMIADVAIDPKCDMSCPSYEVSTFVESALLAAPAGMITIKGVDVWSCDDVPDDYAKIDREYRRKVFQDFLMGFETINDDPADERRFYAGGTKEYLVLTDEEADEIVKERVREDLHCFSSEFILRAARMVRNTAVSESLDYIRNTCNEHCNAFIEEVVERTVGMSTFAAKAVELQGRGHFIASFDEQEHEVNNMYIYRLN